MSVAVLGLLDVDVHEVVGVVDFVAFVVDCPEGVVDFAAFVADCPEVVVDFVDDDGDLAAIAVGDDCGQVGFCQALERCCYLAVSKVTIVCVWITLILRKVKIINSKFKLN